MQNSYPVAGQLWISKVNPTIYMFVNRIEKNNKKGDVIYFSNIINISGIQYQTYVTGFMINYNLFSG